MKVLIMQCVVTTSFATTLLGSSSKGFASSDTSVEPPQGIQLLSISLLLMVFAVLAVNKDDNEQENKTDAKEKSDKPQVHLVRAEKLAFRAGVATGIMGLLQMIPASPREGFAPSVTSLESLEGMQFLSVSVLLLVFAMAVKSEEQKQTETKVKSKVELVRVDAIAFRFAILVGLIGLVKAFGSSGARAQVASMCLQNFFPSLAVVETSEGLQLLSVAVLVLVFALAVCEDATPNSEESERKVELVKPGAIAFRLSAAAAIIGSLKTFGGLVVALWSGLAQMLPASPREGLATTVVSLETGEGIQFLSVSVLLLLFAVLVMREDASEQEDETEVEKTTQVNLVRAHSIAFKGAIAAGFIGVIKTLPASPREGFGTTEVSVEAPDGIQFLCISVLLLVFAVAVHSDKVNSKEEQTETKEEQTETKHSKVALVSVGATAFRAAVLACSIGVLKSFGNAQARAELASLNQKEFAPQVAMIEAPEGIQLLMVSILLFVFTAAANSAEASHQKVKDETQEKVKDETQEKVEIVKLQTEETKEDVELLRPRTIAFRSAMVVGLMGVLLFIDNGIITLPRFAVTGEVALVLATGIAVMLSDVPRQLVTA